MVAVPRSTCPKVTRFDRPAIPQDIRVRNRCIVCLAILGLLFVSRWRQESAPFWPDSWAMDVREQRFAARRPAGAQPAADQPAADQPTALSTSAIYPGDPAIRWFCADLDPARRRASRRGQPFLVYVYATDDKDSSRVYREVLGDRRVQQALCAMVCVSADVREEPGRRLARRYAVKRVPELLLVSPDADVVRTLPLDPTSLADEVHLFRRQISNPRLEEPRAAQPSGMRRPG